MDPNDAPKTVPMCECEMFKMQSAASKQAFWFHMSARAPSFGAAQKRRGKVSIE